MPELLTQLLARLGHEGRGSLFFSLALHVAVVVSLVSLPGGYETNDRRGRERPREVVMLTAPPPEVYRAPPKPEPPAPRPSAGPAERLPKPAPVLELAPPAPQEPARVPPQRARIEIEPLRAPRARAADASEMDAPQLSERGPTEGLAANIEPPPEIARPRLVVLEAGFSGVAAEQGGEHERARLTSGLFGSAEAAGGSGERPAGKIAAAGFGTAGLAESRTAPSRAVKSGGFTRATAEKPAAKRRSAAPPKASSAQPLRVLSKPTPAYTEQARALRIEGEAMIEALFRADGTVEVLRVVHGLGYGLDENAVAAALAFRFEPARRDGKPVDSVVQMRIRFEMAY